MHSKKGSINTTAKDTVGDKPHTNGAEPVENGINGAEDVEMADEGHDPARPVVTKDGDDEMTVVVPPPKGLKLSGESGPDDAVDVAMETPEEDEISSPESDKIDPKVKAMTGKASRG